MNKDKLKKEILEYIIIMAVTAALTLTFLQFVQISRVVGSSMENTYHDGNIVLVNKATYDLEDVKYKDVVVIDSKILNEQIIKRVIGKPGDHIVINEKGVYRNGKLLKENYIKEEMQTFDLDVTVPEGEIFVMGDNRNNSTDSRYLGSIPFDQVVGHVFFKVPL